MRTCPESHSLGQGRTLPVERTPALCLCWSCFILRGSGAGGLGAKAAIFLVAQTTWLMWPSGSSSFGLSQQHTLQHVKSSLNALPTFNIDSSICPQTFIGRLLYARQTARHRDR